MTLSNQLRRAIEGCGLTRYRIAKESGVSESTLSRFMAGGNLTLERLDRIAGILRLSIVMKGPAQRYLNKRKRRDSKRRPGRS